MTQEMARIVSLSEQALLVFETQHSNIDQYTKIAAAVQDAIQCYCVIYGEKKKELIPGHHWIVFSRG